MDEATVIRGVEDRIGQRKRELTGQIMRYAQYAEDAAQKLNVGIRDGWSVADYEDRIYDLSNYARTIEALLARYDALTELG